jgi:glycosyltransferase involved in cell wall biosynthesis
MGRFSECACDTGGGMTEKASIIFVAALPPPVNGQSTVNKAILSALLLAECHVHVHDTSPRGEKRSLIYFVRRLGPALAAAWRILASRERVTSVYLSADSRLGLVLNILHIGMARLTKRRVYLHHHSYSYIVEKKRMMIVLLRIGAGVSRHVFLSHRMEHDFSSVYGRAWSSLICSNAFLMPIERFGGRQLPSANRPIRLALLSNLDRKKGLYEFLGLLRALRRRGVAAEGMLAGPVRNGADAAAIKSAEHELAGALTYHGSVYQEQKSRFFRSADVFVFPTAHEGEAYPLVIVEAMGFGLPVISFDCGCIADIVDPSAGHLVPRGSDFVSGAAPVVEIWAADRARLAEAGEAAARAIARLQERALVQRDNLVRALGTGMSGQ